MPFSSDFHSGSSYSAVDAPYCRVKLTKRGAEIHGAPHCSLGHQLPHEDTGLPEGVFCRWSWDGIRFQLRNDRYGCFPIFYFCREDELCVSPSLPKLLELGAPREFDDAALAVFIRLGYFLGEDTPFRSIRMVPANCSFEWSGGTLQATGCRAAVEPAPITRQEAVDGYIALFRKAIQRRLVEGQDIALPLSGGRDSRHILLELCRIGHSPDFCVTHRHFPPRNDSDARYAEQLCERLKLPLVFLDQPASLLKAELIKNLETSFCTDEHAQFMVVGDYLRGRVQAFYDGTGSNVVIKSKYLKPVWLDCFARGDFEEMARQLLGPDREELLKHLLSTETYQRFGLDSAIGRLAAELKKNSGAPNPPGAFHFWNRMRRELALAPYALFDATPLVFTPFLDHALSDFLLSLPAELVLDNKLQDEALAKEFPELADVPYEDPRTTTYSAAHFKRYARDLFMYASGKWSCNLIRRSFLLPRLARCQVDPHYLGDAAHWLLTPHLAYLVQLERAQEGAVGRRLGQTQPEIGAGADA